MVTQIDEFFPAVKLLLAGSIETDHCLDSLSRARLQGGKAKFAGVSKKHDSSGQANLVTGGDVFFKIWVVGLGGLNGVGDWQRYRVGGAQSV